MLKYSRLLLSRTPWDSLKYIEIPILRHIRFPELRKNLTTKCPEFICNLTPLHKIYILKLLWKRGEIAPEEQFLLLSTIFFTCCKVSMLEQGPEFHFEISGYSR